MHPFLAAPGRLAECNGMDSVLCRRIIRRAVCACNRNFIARSGAAAKPQTGVIEKMQATHARTSGAAAWRRRRKLGRKALPHEPSCAIVPPAHSMVVTLLGSARGWLAALQPSARSFITALLARRPLPALQLLPGRQSTPRQGARCAAGCGGLRRLAPLPSAPLPCPGTAPRSCHRAIPRELQPAGWEPPPPPPPACSPPAAAPSTQVCSVHFLAAMGRAGTRPRGVSTSALATQPLTPAPAPLQAAASPEPSARRRGGRRPAAAAAAAAGEAIVAPMLGPAFQLLLDQQAGPSGVPATAAAPVDGEAGAAAPKPAKRRRPGRASAAAAAAAAAAEADVAVEPAVPLSADDPEAAPAAAEDAAPAEGRRTRARARRGKQAAAGTAGEAAAAEEAQAEGEAEEAEEEAPQKKKKCGGWRREPDAPPISGAWQRRRRARL